MKKNHILLVLLVTFLSTTIYGQETKYGIRLGVGLPSLQSKDDNIYSKDYKTVAGFDGGLFADFGITERFSIKAELALPVKVGKETVYNPYFRHFYQLNYLLYYLQGLLYGLTLTTKLYFHISKFQF